MHRTMHMDMSVVSITTRIYSDLLCLVPQIRGDADFCNTYGGSAGGELSSRLAMYPFMMQVTYAM